MIVYTAIAGDYKIAPRTDIKCFTGERMFERPIMDAKRYKILPHLFLPEHEVTIWVDGNITLLADPLTLIERYLRHGDLALFVHPRRKTVWEEFAELRQDKGRFAIPYLQSKLAEQEAFYRKSGFPGAPLFECNFMIRRNTEDVAKLMNAWWAEICRWQWRDQVSLPYVLWKYGQRVEVRPIVAANIRKNPDFRYVPHY